MRLYLLRQRREIWTESIFQNQFNNFCRHCVTAKSNLRILQQRFILCQKLTLSINKIGETFVKYQTVSCSCLHNNKENRYYSPIFLCSHHKALDLLSVSWVTYVTSSWWHPLLSLWCCHKDLLWALLSDDQSTTALWHQLSCESPPPSGMDRALGPRLPDVWTSGPGPHLRRVITRSGASWSIMEHRPQQALHWRKNESFHPQGYSGWQSLWRLIHGNLDKKRTR